MRYGKRALTLSLVAMDDGMLVGHVAFSPVTINSKADGWYGVAVVLDEAFIDCAPEHSLVREAVERPRLIVVRSLGKF